MENLNPENLSDQNLILLITHDDLYDSNLVEEARMALDKKGLSELELNSLVSSQDEMIEKCRNLILDKRESEAIDILIVENGISDSLVPKLMTSITPKMKVSTIAIAIFLILIIWFMIRSF